MKEIHLFKFTQSYGHFSRRDRYHTQKDIHLIPQYDLRLCELSCAEFHNGKWGQLNAKITLNFYINSLRIALKRKYVTSIFRES